MNLFDQMPEQRRPIRDLGLDDFHDDEHGEPRIPSWRLAEVLDFSHGPKIHQLIERYLSRLERFGTLYHRGTKSTGGRPGSEYLLNFNQAILLVTKSDAPNAEAVQDHIITIYGLWATGKLQPVDQATALVVAEATTRAYQESPELVGMVQTLLALVAELDASHGGRIESVQRTAIEIAEKLQQHLARSTAEILRSVTENAPTPRRPALSDVQQLHDLVVRKYYDGYCPICDSKQYRIIDDEGKHTKQYHHDHWTGNRSKRGTYEMIPVCQMHNYAFENKGARTSPRVKIKAELFFDYVREEEGQLKFGGLHGR